MKYLAAGVALLAVGCPDRSLSKLEPVPAGALSKDIPLRADLDILFVIDNSLSTSDKQTVFASNYPRFVSALDGFPGGRPNLHIGVVTTSVDVGVAGFGAECHPADEDGLLQSASRDPDFVCAPPTAERFLSDVAASDGGRDVNYDGPLEAALSCISHVDDAGCGFEAPLEAIRRALDGSHPENAGFLRRGAFLAVVILTDEDDCSATPELFQLPAADLGADDFRCAQQAYTCNQSVAAKRSGSYSGCRVREDGLLTPPDEYARFLLSLPGPAGVAVALIAGEPSTKIDIGPLTLTLPNGRTISQAFAVQPTCRATINGNVAVGRPPLRLDAMLGDFGDRGLFRTVCQGDYSGALADIGALLFRVISPCLEGEVDTRDTDAANPGLQPDCTVSDFENADTDAQVETLIPRCRMITPDQPDPASARACWWVAANPRACDTATGLELRVERSTAAPPNSVVRVTCAIAPP